MSPSPDQVVFVGQHGAALYVDGDLDHVEDTEAVLRRALAHAGITVTDSDDFLLGAEVEPGDIEKAAAATLAKVTEFTEMTARAVALRAEAQSLLDEATRIEQSLRSGAAA